MLFSRLMGQHCWLIFVGKNWQFFFWANIGPSLCTLLRCTRLQYRTCKTSRGHLASHGLGAHGFSTERARLAGGTSLRSWFQKKCLLPAGILIFLPKKVAATWWDFDFFFKKSGCYLVGFLFFFLRF